MKNALLAASMAVAMAATVPAMAQLYSSSSAVDTAPGATVDMKNDTADDGFMTTDTAGDTSVPGLPATGGGGMHEAL